VKILVTGSAGLVGSETVRFYAKNNDVIGVDNDMRSHFFGSSASTKWKRDQLIEDYPKYKHFSTDIRDNDEISELFLKHGPFDIIIHCAAQPSHDWAAKEPFTDFSINATGTLVLLENFRQHSPKGVFIFMSTNKVYGDTPNNLPLVERSTRWEVHPSHEFADKGIPEEMSIDDSKHSLFGASKVAADVLAQEYGKYFDLNIAVFRGGCLTGPSHSGAELHGFLSYLVKCIVKGKLYTVFGHKGKQVRDNIHSYDLVNAFDHFAKKPRKGEVYNMGGSRHSNISMIEAINKIEQLSGKKANVTFSDDARIGDHIWYVSDVSKFQKHYPDWKFTYDMDMILKEMVDFEMKN